MQTEIIQNPLEKSFAKLASPFQNFIQDQTTSSKILIASTVTALLIDNSPLSHWYESVLELNLGVSLGDASISMDLRHWINEGLMTFFFLLLGMEIKREILVGEIREFSKLTTIIAAAVGGMMVPASIYYSLNAGTEFVHGWGIPLATDTAFAVGVLALLGNRVPPSAFVFLTALAIVDDLGAILVIALFYSDSTSMPHIWVSGILLMALVLCNLLSVRKPAVYMSVGLLIWLAMHGSGIHSTIAGILVAATIPARPARKPSWFLRQTRKLIQKFEYLERNKDSGTPILGESEQHFVVEQVQDAAEKTTTSLRRWENALEHPIALFVLPIFALANAGLILNFDVLYSLWTESITLGIVFGLIIGKVVGIPLFTWLVLRLKIGKLSQDINFQHIIGIGLLSGMGFTMSIFISSLGFSDAPAASAAAKSGILIASFLAGVFGYLWLRLKPGFSSVSLTR